MIPFEELCAALDHHRGAPPAAPAHEFVVPSESPTLDLHPRAEPSVQEELDGQAYGDPVGDAEIQDVTAAVDEESI